MVLFKMLNRGVFKELNGCISTGKEVKPTFYVTVNCRRFFILSNWSLGADCIIELPLTHGSTIYQANVYHAITATGEELAVKVFKTSILVFK